ncbi:MAG: type VI secretion protein [Clostridia bacterium]|nr:type VI secretion protein [Clostridia bacterium]
MDKEKLAAQIRAGNFKANNGRVLRTINILRYKYNKLSGIKYALPDLAEDEILDCINYLHEAEYIEFRHVETKQPTPTGLADHDYRDLEAKLTDKGISLLAYSIKDPSIEV